MTDSLSLLELKELPKEPPLLGPSVLFEGVASTQTRKLLPRQLRSVFIGMPSADCIHAQAGAYGKLCVHPSLPA